VTADRSPPSVSSTRQRNLVSFLVFNLAVTVFTRVRPRKKERAEAQIADRVKRIDFYTSEWTIEVLIQKMGKDEFSIPDYQRHFNWEPPRKSRFIESVLMDLPIPFLTFWQKDDGKLEIVDGSQRLRTLEAFTSGEFELKALNELTELNGSKFADLLESRQRKFFNKSIRAIVLNEDADEQSRSDLFDRINTSSKTAEPGEIRRGALLGPSTNLVDKLATNELFKALAPLTSQDELEREREELITRFFAYGDGLDGDGADKYRDRPSKFLFDYVKKMNVRMTKNRALGKVLEQRFDKVLNFVEAAFPNGFKKSDKGNVTPRATFEAIAVGTDWALKENPKLKVRQTNAWIESEEFRKILRSDGANNKKTLETRIGFVRDRLLEK
jgi:hypothetical protein